MIVELKQQYLSNSLVYIAFFQFLQCFFLSIYNEPFPKAVTCPECCYDIKRGCKRTECIDPKICPELSNLEKIPLNDGNSLFDYDNILLLQYIFKILQEHGIIFYSISLNSQDPRNH